MQHLHNRTEKQLSSAVACEPGNYGKGAWVNQAYSGSPPPVKRNINTVYNPQPMFHSSLENMNHMNMPNPYSAGDKVHTAKKSGCCSAFFKGLWGTAALTKDSKNNPEVMVKANLKELLVYIFFLLDLCLLTYGMTSSSAFYYTKAMTDLFVHYPGNGISFSSIGSMNDVWTYMEFNLLDSLYWNTYYNNVPFVNENQSLIYYENMLLGVPRIRQIKVKKNSCKVHEDFRREITECFDVYKEEKEDDSVFGSVNDTAWQYHTEKELKGSSHWGLLTTYSGSGFYQDLAKTKTESADIIAELKDNLWLDRGTRALFIDFSTYNANVNLFSVIRLVVEFPATGGAISSYQIRTVRLIRYVNTWDYFVMGCELVFCVFIFYYIMEEILEVRVNKVSHFKNIWNIVDLVVILLSLVAIIFSIFRTIKVDKLLSKILEQPNIYADFEFLAFWQTQYNNMNAVNLFFAWVKIFKYISFNKTMSQLTSTLSRCALDIFGFAIMFFIVFFAYAQLGYLLFGMEVETFSTFNKCIFTQFRIILGDFDYDAIDRANRVLGPIYFFSYVFFVFFVLLNMFLAIINDTYSEVKSELSSQKDEFQISDLIKQSYEKTIMKLKLKKEKISDVQKALDSGSSELTFQDFRDALKGMGHSDQEITDAFAKFDHDGNQTLDKLEQEKMKQELDEKRDSLNAELRNLGNGMSADDHGETKDFQRLAQKVTHLENAVALIMSKVNGIMEKMESRDKIDRHMNREDESRPASGGNIQVSLTRTQEQAPPTWSPAVPMGMLRNHLYPDGGWQAISENSSSARH
ncbi:polycystic kidney disease 2-like 1 protein [Triplophysa rosa]|uniref:Polycystic kidney disease 2-like 1 protein n=1 Tax=Triplophysa rosa TaxID=992332 RepID=A0A9W7WN77_TRIRA|nr:polycystic kidney disease 2-like 1 protein [Triplophysa rosa]KAI7805279.1 putative polycystic kidney disease 2-like 1 protein [Triplophysa rosa]